MSTKSTLDYIQIFKCGKHFLISFADNKVLKWNNETGKKITRESNNHELPLPER